MKRFLAKAALLPNGWADDILISVDEQGWILDVDKGQPHSDAIQLDGTVIPGMPNLHSHAFQREMAGLSERATADKNSFWTWREVMYNFLEKLGPDEIEDIATRLYTDMLHAGYTHVGEFHYVHHQPDGTPYEDRAELSHRMIRAAKKAGIGITLLPVLYAHSGFGGQKPEGGQKRFINSPDQFLDIVSSLYREYQNDPQVRIGLAFHSLRAVAPEMIAEVTKAATAIDPRMPIHIHVAEQEKEVEDCLEWSGNRPVEWLLDNAPVGAHWCLIHATHMSEAETRDLAQSGAVVGLCPTTEANLGDGFFNLPDYIRAGGAFGIGSDSHVSVDIVEELRWLEYGQRLSRKERAVARTDEQQHVGAFLYQQAIAGGAQALGGKIGKIESGCRADFLVVNTSKSGMERSLDLLLDDLIFAGNVRISEVIASGIMMRFT